MNRPHKQTTETIWRRIDIRSDDECWPFLGYISPDGYGRISYRKHLWSAHRLVWFLVNGEIPDKGPTSHGTVIRHKCDFPACCNPKHLISGTQLDNISDREARGRGGDHRGIAHGKAKFTDQNIKEIRLSNEPFTDIAARYGVTRTCIWQIWHRKTWRHIP